MAERILLVDDEPDILEFLGYNLRAEGFEVQTCTSGKEALALSTSFRPDLVILDVMMPEMDGVETCIEMRKRPELRNTIIAFLTARNEDYSQVAGFDAGGDDYIAKPIRPRVLVSKVKALLRRHDRAGDAAQNTGHIVLDRDKYLVMCNGEALELPKKEFELLSLLASGAERVFTREQILDKVWGSDVIVGDRTVDVHIRRLREKIGAEHIRTVKGIGYKYID